MTLIDYYWHSIIRARFGEFYLITKVKSLSCVQLFATPWTKAQQAPPSMGFSRQEYWSGLPFPSPGDLPDPGIKPRSPALQADALTSEPPGKPKAHWNTQPKGRPASAGTEAEGLKGAHGLWCCPLTFWTVIPMAVPVLSQRRALFLSAAVCMAQLAETHLSEADCDSLHGMLPLGVWAHRNNTRLPKKPSL